MKEVRLLEQESAIESGKTVDQLRVELGKSLGGDVVVKEFARFQLGEGIEKPTSATTSLSREDGRELELALGSKVGG
ncbi:MAG: hypothetical protein U0263_35680 [Polyangiaceae bacterium]